MLVTRRDLLFICVVAAVYLAASFLGWAALGMIAVFPCLAALLAIVVVVQFEVHRRAHRDGEGQRGDHVQLEALLSLVSVLRIVQPLPPMRGWAISPDFANLLVSVISQERPGHILEIGSGVSTLVAAYCLKRIGSGTLTSLDHDEHFVEQTKRDLQRHGLEGYAEVIYAPLKPVEINGKTWLWYDRDFLSRVEAMDMVIVDGPPGNVGRLSRYPAVPILSERLSQEAVVLLDDANRPDEEQIIEMWLRDYGPFCREDVQCEKGATVLRKVAHLGPP